MIIYCFLLSNYHNFVFGFVVILIMEERYIFVLVVACTVYTVVPHFLEDWFNKMYYL